MPRASRTYEGVPGWYIESQAKRGGKRPLKGSRMVPCPSCDGATVVVDARSNAGRARRRRACVDCGQRFTTYEMTAAQLEAEPKERRHVIGRYLYKLGASLMDEVGAADADGKVPTP